MIVKDLRPEDIRVGLRIKSLSKLREGTVIEINHEDDEYAWVKWDGNDSASSGFYGNDCECEVVLDENEKPVYV